MKRVVVALMVAILVTPHTVAQTEDVVSTFVFQGIDRHYVLHRSATQTGSLPLVVAMHGLNQSIDQMERSWTMNAVADREGFNVVYPVATSGRWAYVNNRPVPLANGKGSVDDIGFIKSLIDQLVSDHVADAAHVYVAGFSNGGLVAWTMACQAADRLAGVAVMSTGMLEPQLDQCHPSRLVPLIVIAGTDDWTQDYDGIPTAAYPLLSIPETLQFWRRLRGCTGSSHATVADHDPADPTTAVLVQWTGCSSPQQFFRIEGGGHIMPSFAPLHTNEMVRHGGRSRAIETAEELWRFFHSLP
jgi:polyhydroxybutyrate depolymerase